jgi:hypothetical protein
VYRKTYTSKLPKNFAKDRQHKWRYGITLEERKQMFDKQGRICAGCGSSEPRHAQGWHLDHNHNTKKLRGILCGNCNAAIGLVGENTDTLAKLVEYLKFHRTNFEAVTV